MTALRAKIQTFSRERLMLVLSVYIICQPLLDILTALGARAGHAVTAGVVVRSLFMALSILYAVFITDFPGKRLPIIYAGILVGYLALFMLQLLLVGGISLCFQNLTEVVKTFFAPFVLVFLYCVYKEYGFSVTTQSIGAAGAVYCSVILLAFLTGTSNVSYANSGYGYNGWFYAANEVGCIVALTAPFTLYHCVKMVPGITKKTWWKVPVIVWCLAAAAFSANFIGTKIVFYFSLLYALAVLVWMLFRLWKERSTAALRQVGVVLMLAVMILGLYPFSALNGYLKNVYDPIIDVPSDELITWWPSENMPDQLPNGVEPGVVLNELQYANEGAWLAGLLTRSPIIQKLDQVLSRRLYSASPSVQVFLDGGIGIKLLGIGYVSTEAYGRSIRFMIEMDPLAILVRHGLVGFVLYCVPYFAFIAYAVIQFFKHPLLRLSSLSYCTLLYCALAGFAIATAAGHALVSPAVSTFVLVGGMQLWVRTQEQNKLPKAQKT